MRAASFFGGSAGAVLVLVQAKGDAENATRHFGSAPALMAAQEKHTDSLQVLVLAAADVTRCLDGNGWSPLLAASGAGHLEVVRLLIDRAPQMVHVRTTAERRWWGRCIAAGSAPVDVARQLQRDSVLQLLAGEIASAGGQPKRLRTEEEMQDEEKAEEDEDECLPPPALSVAAPATITPQWCSRC